MGNYICKSAHIGIFAVYAVSHPVCDSDFLNILERSKRLPGNDEQILRV